MVASGADTDQRLSQSVAEANDPITGFSFRSQFMKRVTDVLASPTDQRAAFAMVAIGIDQFAEITDAFGHAVGLTLLQRVAERLRRSLQPEDQIGQMGENEFAILLPASEGPALAMASQLADLLTRPYLLNGRVVNIGASFGVATALDDRVDAVELHRCATLALSQARADGRGKIRSFDPAMASRANARRTLEFDLRKALTLREFELHYQPQLDVMTGRLAGFEALLRWRHPTRGLVSPDTFIPLAEEIGLITTIGEWVMRTACLEAATWPKDITVGVNVAAAQFDGGRLVGVVEAALAASGLPHKRLDIEVTEGILLREDGVVAKTLHTLHDAGVHISMDDFGTGYSSLTQLQAFPFDKIKIDRSLVTNVANGPNGAVFLRAIAMLGAGLGMRTVVEGIETVAQLERVRAEGCTEVQGYLIGKAVPAKEIPEFIVTLGARLPEFSTQWNNVA